MDEKPQIKVHLEWLYKMVRAGHVTESDVQDVEEAADALLGEVAALKAELAQAQGTWVKTSERLPAERMDVLTVGTPATCCAVQVLNYHPVLKAWLMWHFDIKKQSWSYVKTWAPDLWLDWKMPAIVDEDGVEGEGGRAATV